MCNPQIAVVKGKKAGTFGLISQLTLHSIIDNILMAFEFLFGCWHRKLSRPFTLSGWTYEVCLVCGRKFAYNRAELGGGVPKQEKVGHSKFADAPIHAVLTMQQR